MGWFGFDLNFDGKVSFLEHMIAIGMTGRVNKKESMPDWRPREEEPFPDLQPLQESPEEAEPCGKELYSDEEPCGETLYSKAEIEDACVEIQENIGALENDKTELEDALWNLEMCVPDISSPAYDSWAEHRDELLDRIDQVDSDISDMERSLSDFEEW